MVETAPPVVVGRARERAALSIALDGARAGRAHVVVVRGQPGSGKTTLLDAAVADAAPTRTVRIGGHVAEGDLPYAGIHQLVQRAELPAALASPGEDPLHHASALLAAVTAQAAVEPLLLVVDDAQWLDRDSRRALVFVARRLDADAVCLAFGVRSAAAGELAVGTALDLAPLSRPESLELLRARFPDLTARVAARIAERAEGLPLALCEIPLELEPGQRRGIEPLPTELPLGRSLTRLFAQRIEALSERARLALLAASFEALDARTYRATLAELGCSLDDLDGAERSGLVRVRDGRCTFGHVSVPAAIRGAARRRELAAVHRALAHQLADDPIRAAAHLRQDPDADPTHVVAALQRAARAAADARAHAHAAELWTHAAELSAPTPARSLRLAAAHAFTLAGAGPEASELLTGLLEEAGDDAERAVLVRDLTSVSLWSRSTTPEVGADVRRRLDHLVASPDPAVRGAAVDLTVAWATAALAAGEFPRARQLCRGLEERVPGHLSLEQRLLCDVTAVMVGEAGAGAELRGDWVRAYPWSRVLDPTTPAGYITAALGWLGEDARIDEAVTRCRQALDERGPSAPGSYVLGSMAAARAVRRGRWDHAVLELEAAEQLVLDTDFAAPYPFIALRHAHLLAARGDRDGCERLRRLARRRAPTWVPTMEHLDRCVAGLLALACRDHPTAAAELGRAAEVEQALGLVPSGYLSRAADAFEAVWRLGAPEAQARDLDRFEAAARAVDHQEMLGLVARCRALVADPDDLDACFCAATALLDREPSGFEVARTRLLWGERLRRARRKADAHHQLLLAHATFTRLGATGWAEQCASELAACGARRAELPAGADRLLAQLTPREFEVAREVASGLSNAEAAVRLFVSKRTVEYHLSQVFRKLHIRRRGELAPFFEG